MTRRVALAALVLPALVLVALTARSYKPFGGDPTGERTASPTFMNVSFTLASVVAAVLLVCAVVMGIFVWLLRLRASARKSEWEQARTVFVVVAVALLMGLVLGEGLKRLERRPAAASEEAGVLLRPGQQPAATDEPAPAGVEIVWPLAIGLGLLIAAGLVTAVVLVHLRRRRQITNRERALTEFEDDVTETIDDLRREPDTRKAVIAAYARMERVLSKHGMSRRPAEAPYEYLARAATELDAEKPLRNPAAMWAVARRPARDERRIQLSRAPAVEKPMGQLTALFEEAKFSEHSVDETMRERAIDALVSVRSEVVAAR